MFIANRVGRAASSGDKVQIPAGVAFFLCDVLKMVGSLAGNVDVEARKGDSWWKSGTKSSFWCSHLSRLGSFSCGLAVSVGEAAKLVLFFGHVDNCENCGAVISSVVMAASLFRPVPGSIPGSNTELDKRSVSPSAVRERRARLRVSQVADR